MDESDYQPLSICVVRPVAFPQRPWAPWAQGNGWLSRFSRMEFPHMLGVFDRAEPAPSSRWRWASCCLPLISTTLQVSRSPLAARRSPLAARRSPLAARRSPKTSALAKP